MEQFPIVMYKITFAFCSRFYFFSFTFIFLHHTRTLHRSHIYMYQYLCPPHQTNQVHTPLPPNNHEPPLMTSNTSSLLTPNLSPWSSSQASDRSSQTSFSHLSSPLGYRHQDSLSEDDGCPTPVLSPSLRQQQVKEAVTMNDETHGLPGYDNGAHEPIHMPVNLSLYTNMQYPGPAPINQITHHPPQMPFGPIAYFSASKRQERIARLRARIQQSRGMSMEFNPMAPPPLQPGWPPRFLWCFRSYDVGKNREPWRAFIPQNQQLLWQYPGHDIHIRDPSIGRGMKVITVAADRGIAYHNDPDMRSPQTFEVQLLDIAQRPVVWEPIPSLKR